MLNSLSSTYSNCRKGVLKTFLCVGSQLTEIPKGVKGRRTEGAVYQRCLEVDISEFSDTLIDELVKSLLHCLYLKHINWYIVLSETNQPKNEPEGNYYSLKKLM